ncbi:MAG: TonB-dependent receptor [Bacteroidota bacterium]
MKYIFYLFIFIFFSIYKITSQNSNILSGIVIDNYTNEYLLNVEISVVNSDIKILTDKNGFFKIENLPDGENIIKITQKSYTTKKIPVNNYGNNKLIDLGIIRLTEKIIEDIDQGIISLNEDELIENEKGESNIIAGVLVASKDVFLKTAAYEFSPTFFKPRNLGSEYSTVLLNGVNMNKLFNGKPQWSNWGGLNDVLRNQEYTLNGGPSNFSFRGIAGSTNISTRSSDYKKGVKISYAASNRSYKGRIMASYSSGLLPMGWAYTFSASRRYANEGFREGTLYSANSFFTSIEKKLNYKHSLNFTAIYASNIRGKSSPNTQEVYDLKDNKYNAYWGEQNSTIRNSRLRKINEPIIQLSHFWNINSKTSLQSNITYQFGKTGNTRLDYGGTNLLSNSEESQNITVGGKNPDPTYYQKLPSYFLRDKDNPNYTNAYLAEQEFLKNGQVKWNDLYAANQNILKNGTNSIFALYEDRNDDKQLTLNSILNLKINDNFNVNSAVSYQKLKSENFANMLDLLGGNGFLDLDIYADNIDEAQSDLQNPNRIVKENERFKYNYILDISVINVFGQTQYNSKKIDAFAALNYTNSNYQRNGLFENGAFPGNTSLGKSEALNFNNFGVKTGLTFKLTGRHLFNANVAYLTKAPTLQNSFSNIRENNDIVIGLTDEKILSFDVGYFFRHPKINAKVAAYWINLKDQTDISFYFADGLTGIENSETTAFVQEVLTGVDKQNIGVEIGIEIPILQTIKFKGVVAVGQSIYNNNPSLYLTSDDFIEPLNYGEVFLKNYFVSGGPQHAYSVGFEYNSPKYWWFGATGNYFRNAYINIAPILRTSNFYKDTDGQPINNYDEEIAQELLKQEKFKPYYLLNLVGGKSWKVKNYYFGFFANVSNLLNTPYKTGGFEQSRNANYQTLIEDKSRTLPLFGPKYWFGYGTTFYTSIYFRF